MDTAAKALSGGPVEAFRNMLFEAGLLPGEVAPDGLLRRYPTIEHPRSRNGWAVLHNNPPAGAYGNWSTGLSKTWSQTGEPLADDDRARLRAAIEKQKMEREAKLAEAREEAAGKARAYLAGLVPAEHGSPYLARKGVKPCLGLLADGAHLVVPVHSPADSKPMSYQRISPDGQKRFAKDAPVATGWFEVSGDSGPLLVAEGIATALSLHEATGNTVLVAFSAGNIKAVAQMVRSRYPDRPIILCADNDTSTEDKIGENPGMKCATEAALAVGGLIASPPAGGDFNDVHAVDGVGAVRAIIEAAAPPEHEQADEKKSEHKYVAIGLADFLRHKFPPRQNLLEPWLPSQGLVMIYAYRGVGKTHLALGVAFAAACGGSFLGWKAPEPAGVLYLDGEMPGPVMQERIARMVTDSPVEPIAPFLVVTPDLQPEGMLRIDTEDGQQAVESFLTDEIKLIIVDNISTLTSAKENEADGWTPIQAWALRQRAKGRSVLFIHHSGKTGQQRGTSRREDVLDTVIALRRPAGYHPELGAVFEIHFEKARGLYGDDVKPIEAALVTDDQGRASWATRTVEDSTFDRVVELLNDGLRQTEIAVELGIHKSNVSRHARKATAAGLVEVSKGRRKESVQ
jgi:putative DNA primase/helicase